MKTLAIDYGRAKVGLALADGPLAEPFAVLHISDQLELKAKLKKIVHQQGIAQIVVGISEGAMARATRKFVESLKSEVDLPIIFWDETLSSRDAQRLARQAGVKKSRRRRLEDAFAATIVLQSFLDHGHVQKRN